VTDEPAISAAHPVEALASRHLGTFASLRHRNFRLFFIGQMISMTGTWMQRIAQSWLVLQLTNSPFLLGLVGMLQWLPVLCFSLIGGVVADRVNKRGLLVVTQTVQMLQAVALGLLVLSGAVRFWHVAVLAMVLGMASAFDMPSRQAFIFEMVEGTDTMNAVALNSTIVNVARLLGPAVAGVAIGWVGMASAFLVNGVSFIPVIIALLLMRVRPTHLVRTTNGVLTHLREGIAYLGRSPAALQVFVLLAVESVFALNFTLLSSVLAKDVLHAGAAGFGFLMSSQGAGALVGAITVASLAYLGPRPAFLFAGATVLGIAEVVLSITRQFPAAAVMLGVAGASMVFFTATVNTMLQLDAPDHLRGRVMSMYSLLHGGLTPIGALVAGTLAQIWGAPGAFLVGGVAGLAAVAAVLRWRAVTPDPGAQPAG
jgi:MFS family permease